MKYARVWYTGGRSYTVHSLEEWKALPAEELLVVIVMHDDGEHSYRVVGGDWYWWEDDQIRKIASGDWGTWKEPPPVDCVECVKKGVGVPDEEFRLLMEAEVKPYVRYIHTN